MLPFPRGQDGASVLASEDPAEHEAVPADPHVNPFGDPNHARDPEQQRHGDQQRQPHANESKTPCPAMDPSVQGDTVDGFKQVLPTDRGGREARIGMRDGQKPQPVEPVEPGQQFHLKRAEWTIAVEEHHVVSIFRGRIDHDSSEGNGSKAKPSNAGKNQDDTQALSEYPTTMKISPKVSMATAAVMILGFGVTSMSAGSDKTDLKDTKSPAIMKRIEVLSKTGDRTRKQAEKKQDPTKTVEVTGSRIKVKNPTSREIFHGQSQVQVIDQNLIRRSGRSDLLGVLSHLPGAR